MRRVWVYVNGVAYEKGTEPRASYPMIMPDIKPYHSMIDGSEITSRSRHREHLRAHGYQEVGNDTGALLRSRQGIPDCDPQGRKELIRAQIDAMSQAEFKQAVTRDVQRVKWNSRKE